MRQNSQNKFNFFVSCNSLQKGQNDDGKDVVIIDGIASTSSVDSQEDQLMPAGFNLKPFLESGLVNFNHQSSKDPNAVIGVPLEAKIINEGQDLYVKCMLWPCPQTEGIVRAYDSFKKYNINRTIGFSIEGNSLLRAHPDKSHPGYKKILKADITGLAVTFSPVNKNTLMNIVKGNYSQAFQPLTEEDEIKPGALSDELLITYAKKTSENDLKRVIKESNDPRLRKAAQDELERRGLTEKAMDMPAVGKTVPEDVDRGLSKAEVSIEINKRYTTLSVLDKQRILDLVNKVARVGVL